MKCNVDLNHVGASEFEVVAECWMLVQDFWAAEALNISFSLSDNKGQRPKGVGVAQSRMCHG